MNTLNAGQTYCLSFWVNLAEGAGYGQNKIGAYLDNGAINKLPIPTCTEILTVTPQVYTNDVITDTANWIKIEGNFVANGNETHITIGNFFPNSATSVITTNYWLLSPQISYYLIDDVSVIPIDLDADAGKDTWVEQGKRRQIGRVGDTTAEALDCKWYHRGSLIDSGAIISVPANATVGATDTYIVVQTVCGLSKSDTVLVRTVPLGVQEWDMKHAITIFPNPAHGSIHIQCISYMENVRAFDLSGRVVMRQPALKGNSTSLDLPPGLYIVEIQTADGATERQRVLVE
ncbi:MAG: T9SS type A sorting domain-containing protein [Chitinophagaceae bacterium]